jgi:hypothetical protein
VAIRVPRWRGKLLNAVARLALINSVLFAMTIFMLIVFWLGKWAFKKIYRNKMNFLWKFKNDEAKGLDE